MCSKVEGGTAGCVVVFAAFFIQVLAFGTSQSVGVYNIEFLRAFDVGAAAVSLVGSINLGVFLGAGPLASVLMSRWSHRQVALVGAALSSIGLICMPFAPNIPYMYFFYGVITGLGCCLVYVPSHVLSGLYFNKHRSLATGIATAGSGMGATIFPIIIYNLIEYYGWRGSLFIMAGLNLHLLIFSALLFPVPKALLKSYEEEAKSEDININAKEDVIDAVADIQHEELESECLYEVKQEDKTYRPEVTFSKDTYGSKTSNEEAESVMLNGPVLNSGSQRRPSMSQRLERHFCSIFNFSFIIFFISNICWNAGGAVVLIFLPEYMTSVGLTKEEASSVFTLVGAGSCIGCVLGGLLGNIKYINRVFLYILGNVGAGVLTLLYPWPLLHTHVGQSLLSVFFGLMFGIILGLLVVVTADILGMKSLGDGFGYLMFANGIGVFGGPPLAGILIDSQNDLDPGFYLGGTLTIMGGVVMCVVPLYKKFTRENIAEVMELEIESPVQV